MSHACAHRVYPIEHLVHPHGQHSHTWTLTLRDQHVACAGSDEMWLFIPRAWLNSYLTRSSYRYAPRDRRIAAATATAAAVHAALVASPSIERCGVWPSPTPFRVCPPGTRSFSSVRGICSSRLPSAVVSACHPASSFRSPRHPALRCSPSTSLTMPISSSF